jgi:hypothetical protein
MSKNFVVCAVQKVHDWTCLKNRAGHNERATPPAHAAKRGEPNAPAWRSHKVAYLVGGPGFADAWKIQHGQCHQRKLKDGQSPVIARELVISASPEFFAGKGRREVDEWAETVKQWAIGRWGADRVGQMALHLDEQTPHAHLWLKPIKASKKHGWEISDRSLGFDGREAMIELHDSIAAAVAPLGLSRGLRGSPATHQETARWRAQMADAQKALPRINWTPILVPPTVRDRMNPTAYGKRVAKAALAQVAPSHAAALAQASEVRRARRERGRLLSQIEALNKAGEQAASVLAFLAELAGRVLGLGRPLDPNSLADLSQLRAQLAPKAAPAAPPPTNESQKPARREPSAPVALPPRRTL